MEFAPAFFGFLAAVVVAWMGNRYTKAVREREIQGKLVERALDILQLQETDENSKLREWGRKVVNQFSGVELQKIDIEKTAFPSRQPQSDYRSMAITLRNKGHYEAAAQAYRMAFELDSRDPAPLNFAGAIYSKYLGDHEQAEKLYTQALEVDSDYISAIYNKACNEVRRKDYDRALKYLSEAIGRDAKYRDMAQRDSVFELIPEDGDAHRHFKELVSSEA